MLTLERSHRLSVAFDAPESVLLAEIKARRNEKQQEMSRFSDLCDRYDNLYYPNDIHKAGGADHWPEHESARIPGRVHVSLNVFPEYVDIPASLTTVEPIENVLPLSETPEARSIAAQVERVYFAWKDEEEFELKAHKACVVKGLYGRTAAKVYWDDELKRPCVKVVDQPRNLWLGWATDNYERLDWVIYSYRISISEAIAQYGVDYDITELKEGDHTVRVPVLRPRSRDVLTDVPTQLQTREWIRDEQYMVECVDYWYRQPKKGADIVPGEPTPMETWNAIFVGNFLVKDMPHKEYGGWLPYVPLFNTYIPGLPDGKSEFYDIEQIIREKEERLSEGGQMIRSAIKGQKWQLRGQEAPDVVPLGLKPKDDTVVAPGAGNWIEKIEPFMPEFQLEQYLNRLDRELVDVSGLNDLLRGLAPSQVLSSSKAINALVANYEARIRIKRDLYYRWRKGIWKLAQRVWGQKVKDLGAVFVMAGRLVVDPPSITPRDDLETATMAANLLNSKIWAQERAMDITGVDDPEAEQDLIRKQRTDASMFPADVQVQMALLAQMQQLQMTQQQAQQEQMAQQAAQGQAAQRESLGGQQGMPMMNGEGEQPVLPPEGLPANAGGLPPSGPGENFLAQTQIQGGEANNRLLLQQPVAPEEESGGGY